MNNFRKILETTTTAFTTKKDIRILINDKKNEISLVKKQFKNQLKTLEKDLIALQLELQKLKKQ